MVTEDERVIESLECGLARDAALTKGYDALAALFEDIRRDGDDGYSIHLKITAVTAAIAVMTNQPRSSSDSL